MLYLYIPKSPTHPAYAPYAHQAQQKRFKWLYYYMFIYFPKAEMAHLLLPLQRRAQVYLG